MRFSGVAFALVGLAAACGGKSDDTGSGQDTVQRFTILHTNDWQSHMLGQGPNAEYTADITGDDTTWGGIARVKTLVDEIRGAATDPVVLYDGGDWMAGALFQLLATSHASELQMMDLLGYDAITIGNHEFDWGAEVLGDMIAKADDLGVTVPIVASNIEPNVDDAGDDALEAHFDSGRIETTRVDVLENGLTLGLFGLVGDSAAEVTTGEYPASFTPMIDAAADAVATLEAQDVDLIIGITHAGVADELSNSDAELVAAAVPGIDILVDGHSHTPLFDPIVTEEGTVIVQAGAYTRYLGQLDLVLDAGVLSVEGYQLHAIDDTIPGDPEVTSLVDGFITALEEGPLTELGYGFNDPILAVPGDITVSACAESGLGDFVTDAFRYAMNQTAADPIRVAVESQGVIRDNLLAGETGIETFADVFRVMPLGFGTDDVPGYPLVSFYVEGDEVADICEVTASLAPSYGCDYFAEISGMRCELDMERSSFNRVIKVELLNDDGEYEEIDISMGAEGLYHVAVDHYVATFMSILR